MFKYLSNNVSYFCIQKKTKYTRYYNLDLFNWIYQIHIKNNTTGRHSPFII